VITNTFDDEIACELYSDTSVSGKVHLCAIGTLVPSQRILDSLSDVDPGRMSMQLLDTLLNYKRDTEDLHLSFEEEEETRTFDWCAQLNESQNRAVERGLKVSEEGGFALIHGTADGNIVLTNQVLQAQENRPPLQGFFVSCGGDNVMFCNVLPRTLP
jgi:hypothetical protein